MKGMRVYLVVAADRSVRVVKRLHLRDDEIAIAINLRFPDRWGRIVQTYDVDVPDFVPSVEVEGAVPT